MANERNCAYCGTVISPGDEICPSCGAPNPHFAPGGEGGTRKPRTIEELKAFCEAKGMPLEKMRFFIGVNEPSPKCFGIYRQGDRFIVYKNKSDGSRAVRYDGPDEAHAVSELYEKLLEEHRLRQGGGTRSGGSASSNVRRKSSRISTVIAVIVILVAFLYQMVGGRLGHRKDGYYRSGDGLYYRYGSSWYMDSGYDDWESVADFPEDDYGSYYIGDDYDDSWGYSDFTDSWAWESLQDSDDDDDWDWDDDDYDDWDSGDTDWDSDW